MGENPASGTKACAQCGADVTSAPRVKDSKGNYLLSARHVFTITYVDGRTGEVIWHLGGGHLDEDPGPVPDCLARDRRMVENLRDRGVIRRPEDLGIDPRDATRNLLAARSVRDLVDASGGLYQPPARWRNW